MKELIKRIKQKLGSSKDFYLKYAYTHANILDYIVKPEDSNRGGSCRNGIIYVGKIAFNGGKMGSDEDIMATIFHEFMHHIAFKENKLPYRYENKETGEIWSINISLGEALETEEEFREEQYQLFLLSKISNIEEYDKYPSFYQTLTNKQKAEFEKYIQEKRAQPMIKEKRYQYAPSNYTLDEINAHTKTLEANQLEVFNMSQAKLTFYDNEIKRYKSVHNTCIGIEREYKYTPEGYKK